MPPTSQPDAVTLKEYLSEWSRLHNDIHDLQNRILQERFAAMDKAVAIQHTEYSRRLDELNHAHQQQRQDFDRYLPRSTYEDFASGYSEWKDNFMNEHTALMLRMSQNEGAVGTMNVRADGLAQRVDKLEKRDVSVEGKLSGGALVVQYAGIALGLIATMLAIGGIISGLLK